MTADQQQIRNLHPEVDRDGRAEGINENLPDLQV
jgi:hypothetical protein